MLKPKKPLHLRKDTHKLIASLKEIVLTFRKGWDQGKSGQEIFRCADKLSGRIRRYFLLGRPTCKVNRSRLEPERIGALVQNFEGEDIWLALWDFGSPMDFFSNRLVLIVFLCERLKHQVTRNDCAAAATSFAIFSRIIELEDILRQKDLIEGGRGTSKGGYAASGTVRENHIIGNSDRQKCIEYAKTLLQMNPTLSASRIAALISRRRLKLKEDYQTATIRKWISKAKLRNRP